jgi:hypothetical protein
LLRIVRHGWSCLGGWLSSSRRIRWHGLGESARWFRALSETFVFYEVIGNNHEALISFEVSNLDEGTVQFLMNNLHRHIAEVKTLQSSKLVHYHFCL